MPSLRFRFPALSFLALTLPLASATAAAQNTVAQNPAGVAVRVDSLSGAVSILDELIARPRPTGVSRAELAAWNDQTAWLDSVRNRYRTLAEAYAAAGGTSNSAPLVPGGAVVSAAVSGGNIRAGGSAGAGGADAQAASSSAAPSTDPMAELDAQFLALQDAIQMESRRFQTLSNASKARHDVAMNAIRNMK